MKNIKKATPAQRAVLRRHGYDENISKAAAWKIIQRISENGWKSVPKPECEGKDFGGFPDMEVEDWKKVGRLA